MDLTSEYKRQLKWRNWEKALSLCPILPGQQILDLGCGPGDISQLIAEKGALVTGIDNNLDLLSAARKNGAKNCSFIQQDLTTLDLGDKKFDGLWTSFVAAYFVDLEKILPLWISALTNDAWICIVEIDNLFGHEPLPPPIKDSIDTFYADSLSKKRYDFNMGRRIAPLLTSLGFRVETTILEDKELSFQSVANEEVIRAWSDRLDRMKGLQYFLAVDFQKFREEFLLSLRNRNHRSNCRVICNVGLPPLMGESQPG